MIERKTTKRVSKLYLHDLRYRLGIFKEVFHCDVSAITPESCMEMLFPEDFLNVADFLSDLAAGLFRRATVF